MWTPQKVKELAPDAASAKAGEGLAKPAKWALMGRSERAVWGEIKGSGAKPYQVRIDLSAPAFKCSCPSRKFPCKHALGLFLILADNPEKVPAGDEPGWVADWLASREQRQTQQVEKAQQKAAEPKDPAAQARRAAQREDKVKAGVEELSIWLGDLVRQGLANAQSQPPSFWDNMAARMVDAQASGLARQVRLLAEAASSGDGWQERLLAGVGRVHLLAQAYRRLDRLPERVQADVRATIGWSVNKEQLLQLPGLRDTWLVLAQLIEEEDRLRAQRTWLWGRDTRRFAMVLQYAAGGQAFESTLVTGTGFSAELIYYPGELPMRAMVKEQDGVAVPVTDLPGALPISQAIAGYSQALARSPWLERFPMTLAEVRPVHHAADAEVGSWSLIDSEGDSLPLSPRCDLGWHLLALSGGEPVTLFGEWDGAYLKPLSVASQDRFHVVAQDEETLSLARTA